MEKLDMQHKHIMRLIDRDANEEGWATVSKTLYPHISSNMPTELVECEQTDNGGRARLTEQGKNVIEAMNWL